MQGTIEATKDIDAGSIMQIAPDANLATGETTGLIDMRRLQLVTVTVKESWGVVATLADGDVVRLAWAHIEPTGGRIIWAADGQRVAPLPAGIKHHE